MAFRPRLLSLINRVYTFADLMKKGFFLHASTSLAFFFVNVCFYGLRTFTEIKSVYNLATEEHKKWAYLTFFFTFTPFVVDLIILIGAKSLMLIKGQDNKKVEQRNLFLQIFGHFRVVQHLRSVLKFYLQLDLMT